MHKDTESTIHLNTSLGNLGDEILGNTFTQDKSMDDDIGEIHKHSNEAFEFLGNRMSKISA